MNELFIDCVDGPVRMRPLQLPVRTEAAWRRVRQRWQEGMRSTPCRADEETLHTAYRRTILRMAEEVCPYTAERLAELSFDELRRLTTEDYRSFERFSSLVQWFGVLPSRGSHTASR